MKLVSNSVCVFVYRCLPARDGEPEYLVLRRTESRGGFWQPVTGRPVAREAAEDAARRETLEETGLTGERLLVLEKVHVYFKPGRRRIYFEPCFALQVAGAAVTLSKEHDAHEWLAYEEAAARLPHGGLREALRELHARVGGARQ